MIIIRCALYDIDQSFNNWLMKYTLNDNLNTNKINFDVFCLYRQLTK